VTRNADEVLIIPQIFRGTPAGKEYPEILLWLDVSKSNVRLNSVTFKFSCNFAVPIQRDLVKNHMISPFFRTSHNRLETILLQTVIRI
jgi:hypothetical protein